MNDHDAERRVQELLDDAYPTDDMHFQSGFADRVLARMHAAPAPDLGATLARQGLRLVPALLAASIALVAWNVRATHATADSLIAAALGIQQPVPDSASTSVSMLEGAEAFQ